ncbi:MAG: imidazole glycerol phosphate synthase subunit HisH [Chlorobium sp.]|uniref:imidazole glycerol phosphate synthase subunit HisH n=1 Tax=Chlorobium sp. TaxID=1095 RepID=UPI002F42A621
MIALVDYGLGNIQAFANIYKRLGIKVLVAKTPSDVRRASKIILPGVGAFDWAMTRLQDSGLRETLDEEVLVKKKPILGVCVGMQMLAHSSEEGILPGLGWINATVVKFDSQYLNGQTHLPHMGWNDVEPCNCDLLFRGLDTPRYYFLHSFFMKPHQKEITIATAQYGISFTAAVRSGNVYGTQFHPEKSHEWGIGLLKNFAELA